MDRLGGVACSGGVEWVEKEPRSETNSQWFVVGDVEREPTFGRNISDSREEQVLVPGEIISLW